MTDMKRLVAALAAVLAVSAVFTLSACAVTGQPARPGTAALYDGATITTEQVAAWGTAQNEMGFSSYDPGAVLTLLLLRPAMEAEAAKEGIAFGDDQIAQEAQQWMTSAKADVIDPTPTMMDVVRAVRIFQALAMTKDGAASLQADISSIDADAVVSPSYGHFSSSAMIASVNTIAQQDATAYGDVSYLVFKDMTGFDPKAQRGWMVDEGSPSASPSPSPSPSPAP